MNISALRSLVFLLAALCYPAFAQTQSAEAPERLELGKPLLRELAGGQTHAYPLTLAAGQYLNVIVDQRGIDVVVRLFAPDGKKLTEVDSPGGPVGPERLEHIASAAGEYRIEVLPLEKKAPTGRYEIRLNELRAATAKDPVLVEARALINAATVLDFQGKIEEAIKLGERAVALREEALGLDHAGVAAALNRLGILCERSGDSARAVPIYQRALAIHEKQSGVDSAAAAGAAHNLAMAYVSLEDYVKAEPLFLRARTSLEKSGEAGRANLAQVLDSLAGLYLRMGDVAKAEPLYLRALELREKLFGPDALLAIYSLNNLAVLYDQAREFDKAASLHQRSLALKEKRFDPNHPEIAISLNNLALHYVQVGDLEQAKRSFRRALEILEKRTAPNPLDFSLSLGGLAALELNEGHDREAEPLLQRSLALREKTLGESHELIAEALGSLISLYHIRGDFKQALAALTRSADIAERFIDHNLLIGSERRKLAYLDQTSRNLSKAISLQAQLAPNDPQAIQFALTLLLRWKGRALDVMADSIARLRLRAAPEDQARFDELTTVRARLGTLKLRGPVDMTPAAFHFQVKQLEERMEKLEEDLSARSAEFKMQSQPVTFAVVQAALPPGAVLVEFALYSPYRTATRNFAPRRYIAYAIARAGAPRWVEIGEAADVDRAIEMFRATLRAPNRAGFREASRALDRIVMQPLRPLLGDAEQVLLSPEGSLNLLPFAALLDERGRYRVERYSFSYLTSGRDLLRLNAAATPRDAPLIVANPSFGETAASANHQRGMGVGANAGPTQGMGFSQVQFRALPGTADEARAILRILPDARALMKEEATKTALKAVHGPRILHIATHGFFLKDADLPEPNSRGLGLSLNESKKEPSLENALLRSGLVLAGANAHREAPDDGILTAMELAGLDLQGTRMVVLSACNTGLGEIKRGEGVYGLRRALTLAGAESQVMSLWPVSDQATRDLMIAFYQGLQRGQSRSEALRQVQLRMLRSGAHRHPYYWASFIQSGAWMKLDWK